MLKKLKNAFFAMLAFSCFAFTFIACPQPTTTDGGGSEATLSLSESSITLTTVGETKQIKATYTGSSTLSWTVEDSNIATVEVASDTLSATVKALKAGSTTLTVKEANGSLSASVKITNSISAQAVSGLEKTSADSSSVTISWTAPTNVENYTVKVYKLTTSDEETPVKFTTDDEGNNVLSTDDDANYEITVDSSKTSCTVKGLSANTTYKFYVYTNYGGVQSSSQSVEATTSSISIELALDSTIDFEKAQSAGTTFTLVATITDSSSETNTLKITEWTSSNTEIATVTADETDSNKATVSIVGPSETVNITATIKDGDSELASKSYSVTIIGKAVDSSNVTVTVQSSASDETLSDKQVKVSWDAPSYVTSYKVELYKVDSADATIAEDASADVTSPADGEDAITTTSVTLTVSDYGYYIAKVYSIYGNDTSSGVISPATQVKDFKPCDNVSGVKLDLSATTPSLTWSDPSDSDLKSIEIYVDSTIVTELKAAGKYEDKSLSSASSIKIITVDTAGNKSSGVTVTVGTAPSLSDSSTTTTGYTGQLVVSGLELTSGVTYTVKYAGEVEGATAILDADNSKVYINGLTVGTEETPKFTLTATYSDYTVVYPTLSGTATKPTMTVAKIKQVYNSADVVPYNTSSISYNNVVAVTSVSDITISDATYDRWIVWPALDDSVDGFSLSAAKAGETSITDSSLYLYADLDKSKEWNSSYNVMKGSSWNYVYDGNPQVWIAESDMISTNTSYASFTASVGSPTEKNSAVSVPTDYDDFNDGWNVIKVNAGTYYLYCSCLNVSAQSTVETTNGDYNYAFFTEEISDSDKTAPNDATSLTAIVGRDNVKLSWLPSTSPDVKGYNIYKDSETSTVIDTVIGLSASIKNLTADTEYEFTVKAVDYAGNESTGVSVKATPTKPSASNVSADEKYTGSVLVTWTDTTASETDDSGNAITYTYKVTLTGTSSKEMTVESGVGQAHFTGLTIGDSYTGATVQCIPSDNESAGATVTVTKDITVSKVLWKIACDEYDNTNRLYRILPAIYTGSTYTTSNHIIVEFDGTESGNSANSEWQYLSYGVWEVVPALADSSDASKFSLMASTSAGVETGLYFYGDKNRSISSGTYYAQHWGSENNLSATSSYPVLFFVAPAESGGEYIDTENSDDLASATFSLSEASTSITTLMSNNSYGTQMYYIYTTMDNTDYYWSDIHTLCEGTTNSSLKTSFAICETTLTEDTLASAPSEVSNLNYDSDSLSAISVTLTWTNPTEADFDHVLISWGTGDDESVTATGTSATITGLTPETSYSFTVKTVDMMGNTSDGISTSVTTIAGTNYPTNATATVGYTGQIVVTWTDANISSDYTYTVSATSSGGSDTVADVTVEQGTQKAVFNELTVGNTYTFTLKATLDSNDYEYAGDTLSAQAVKVLWHLVEGYGNRVMMCNILNNTENSCTTDYNVIAEDASQSTGSSGNCKVVSFSTLSYPYWLVMPSLSSPKDTDHFSLMASDSTGTESGYYLYSDSSRNVSSTSNLAYWWTDINTVNGWSPKLFVAKTSESYITDNSMASFTQASSSYSNSSKTWVNFKCDYDNYYVQHSNLIYRLRESITEENCAALSITQTTLTKQFVCSNKNITKLRMAFKLINPA